MRENNSAWCFDREDENGEPYDFTVYGSSENMPHRRLDLSFIPCTPKIGTSREHPGEECLIPNSRGYEAKLNEAIEYIGSPNLYILTNRQHLQSTSFESGSVDETLSLYNQ
jgi:hypothetical protein